MLVCEIDAKKRIERGNQMASGMNTPEIVQALLPVAEALESLGVVYHLGGSVASSLHGTARPTQDIDLVADLQTAQVRRFVMLLGPDYYADEASIREALRQRTSFNVIHMDLGMKIDIFIPKLRPFDQEELQQVRQLPLEPGGRTFPVKSPEVLVLRKLEWYEMGGRVSQRQWRDLVGILQHAQSTLDLAYLNHWASVLGVQALLTQALQEAGVK
jgi:hypothetical protein